MSMRPRYRIVREAPDLAIPALSETLADREYSVRVGAIKSLARFGSRAEGAVAALLALAKNSGPYEKFAAIWALEKIDRKAAASVEQ